MNSAATAAMGWDDSNDGGASLDCDKTVAEVRQACDKMAAAARQQQLRQQRHRRELGLAWWQQQCG